MLAPCMNRENTAQDVIYVHWYAVVIAADYDAGVNDFYWTPILDSVDHI